MHMLKKIVGIHCMFERFHDFFFKDFIYLFLEGEGREKDRVKHQYERETLMGCCFL